MKNILQTCITAGVIIGLAACANIQETAKDYVRDKPKVEQKLGGDLRVFDGNSCSGSGGNCLPDVIITPAVHFEHDVAFTTFDNAVDTGTTGTYFSSDDWRYLIPALAEHPRMLKELQAGTPILKFQKTRNSTYYVATKLDRASLAKRLREAKGRHVEEISSCFQIVKK